MSLDDIVNITITASSQTPTRAGFGTPLIAAYHTHFTDRVRSYTSLSGMVSDGFTTSEAAYLGAQTLFSQSPRVTRVKIGRRATAFSQHVSITPESPTTGKVYSLKVGGTTVTYTAIGGDDLAAINTALATAITALPAVTAVATGGTHVVATTDTAGNLVSYDSLSSTLTISTTTTDPGIAADLTAIRDADPDWYGLLIDSNSSAEIAAAAAWVEANGVLFAAQSSDSAILDSASTTDIGYTLKQAAYARTSLWYQLAIGGGGVAPGILGDRLPHDPGSDTWAYKTLNGVASYTLTDTQKANAHAKNVGTYTPISGINVTEEGKTSSGEWVDVTRFIDWLHSRMQERIFFLIVNREKIPYTDPGVQLVLAEITGQLNEGITVGGLASDPAPTVTAPKVADVASLDRANRYLPNINFGARLAGAIHTLNITGTVTV